ncbi:hypothetical protein SPONN_9 [uncultured Candidatus Thioglobus sp.]|nr:hypothetical protein SPONN_9 [uncultured Candidatus Thioglobus sp.]
MAGRKAKDSKVGSSDEESVSSASDIENEDAKACTKTKVIEKKRNKRRRPSRYSSEGSPSKNEELFAASMKHSKF